MKGQVARFFPDKGFGFIRASKEPDHFFHIDDAINFTRDTVTVGMDVEFESETTGKGKRAYQITA
jgi:cold shock CspA family protein